eukprot:3937856-Prymnesium_polylepis.1
MHAFTSMCMSVAGRLNTSASFILPWSSRACLRIICQHNRRHKRRERNIAAFAGRCGARNGWRHTDRSEGTQILNALEELEVLRRLGAMGQQLQIFPHQTSLRHL